MALDSNPHFPHRPTLSGAAAACAAILLLSSTATGVPPDPIPAPDAMFGPSEPAISPNGSRLAFSYAGDLWIVGASGGKARRLTEGPDFDRRPVWSHDGRSIAFARVRDGVQNLWILRLPDEQERQLTHHESPDWPNAFAPDDLSVLFHSARSGEERIYRVSVEGGEPEALTFDLSSDGDLDRSGSRLLFTRGLVPWWRQGYRGSAAQDVYLLDLETRACRRLTQFAGCDLWPRWEPDGSALIFATDESFARNLWRLEIETGRRTQLTNHLDGPVEFPQISADGRWIVYAQNGTIWKVGLDPLTPARQLMIECDPQMEDTVLVVIEPGESGAGSDAAGGDWEPAGEPAQTLFRPSSGAERILPLPGGSDVFIEAYGGIFALRLNSGDAVQNSKASDRTGSPPVLRAVSLVEGAAREAGATLSPDGRRLLFSSDRAGNRDLFYLDLDRAARLDSGKPPSPFRTNFREEFAPVYSPDGRFVAYRRREAGEQLMLADAEGGRETAIARGVRFGEFSFSPDSRWIAYAKLDELGNWDVHLVSLFSGETYNATEHPGTDLDPRWSADGRMLYFRSDRAGSMDLWGIYLREPDAWDATVGTRRSDSSAGTFETSESSVEDFEASESDADAFGAFEQDAVALEAFGSDAESFDAHESSVKAPEVFESVGIDLPGLSGRAAQITSLFGEESEYALGADGSIALVSEVLGAREVWLMTDRRAVPRRLSAGSPPTGAGAHSLVYADGFYWALDRDGTILRFAPDGSALVSWRFRAEERWSLRQLHEQELREVWRELRDGFYSEHMHLAGWDAVLERYRKRLAGVHTREELQSLVLRMAGELNASHVGFESFEIADTLRTGDLGLVLEPEARKRRGTRSGGEDPGLEVREVAPGGPAARAGIRVGDRLLSVDGVAVTERTALDRLLRGKAGRSIELAWSGGKSGRAEVVTMSAPLARAVRGRESARWRRELVERMGRGRIGYVRIESIDRRSLDALVRELQVAQRDKDAIILDFRDNAGGDLPEEFLRRLAMPALTQRQPRGQRMQPAPSALWTRSMAVLIGPGTGSAAEVVASGLGEMERVRLVGEPTYGGVIGADEIELLDGSVFRIPRIGWFTASGDNLEGRGVAPDLLVAAEFEEESRGEDRQLIAAVRELLSTSGARR